MRRFKSKRDDNQNEAPSFSKKKGSDWIKAHQTSAEILALAAVELFPDTLLLQGEGTGSTFFYDFHFPFPFQSEFLPLLEERMRQVVKRDLDIQVLEMVPGNAASLLKHRDQPVLAEKLRLEELSLVQIIQIGNFADWCQYPVLTSWNPDYLFRLLEFFPVTVGDSAFVRVVGVLGWDKGNLKEVIKQAPSYAGSEHLSLVSKWNLFAPVEDGCEGLWTWLPKAYQVQSALIKWWRQELEGENFTFMQTPSCLQVSEDEDPSFYMMQAHKNYWDTLGDDRICKLAEISYMSTLKRKELKNGLLDPTAWVSDRAHLFVPDSELFQECISSLQFIAKIPKILSFEFQIVLYTGNGGAQKLNSKGSQAYLLLQKVLNDGGWDYIAIQDPMLEMDSRIQLRIADSLGRFWDGPFMGIAVSANVKNGFTCIVQSTFNCFERLIALYAEKNGNRWPFWLSNEQVRIIVVDSNCGEYVSFVKKRLEKVGARVGVDPMLTPLKNRMRDALTEQIPFVLLIGDREMRSQGISYRTSDVPSNQQMGIDEFINMIIELNGSHYSELEN